jgi:hypothetical protein
MGLIFEHNLSIILLTQNKDIYCVEAHRKSDVPYDSGCAMQGSNPENVRCSGAPAAEELLPHPTKPGFLRQVPGCIRYTPCWSSKTA